MKVLALERGRPGVDEAGFARHLEAEARGVWSLQQQGVIREIYFRADRTEAVLILEADSLEEAEAMLAALPLVRERLIDFELIALRPYDGFARLFRDRGE